ncbi:MAG: phosphatase PAP2 family protein [Vicinamibacteria bacterium]
MRRLVLLLRPEEAITLAFVLPTSYLTIAANLYAREAGVLTARHPGGLYRLALALVLLVGLFGARRLFPGSPRVALARETLPFLACLLIYTNLHDTIGFVNPRDVHEFLAALDAELFGVQPTVWAERFVSRGRTELMSFFYVNFFWLAPSTSLVLLARRRFAEFRAATLCVLVCFYVGYALYVIFPAAPPRLALVYQYTRTLEGYPQAFSALSAKAFELLPTDSRAAFPSLHAGASLVALLMARRYVRPLFWLLLPFVVGLWVSTIYLRHHFVVDLLAGWALAPVAIWAAPRLDAWWARQQVALGIEPAPGAIRG